MQNGAIKRQESYDYWECHEETLMSDDRCFENPDIINTLARFLSPVRGFAWVFLQYVYRNVWSQHPLWFPCKGGMFIENAWHFLAL